jgi:hypothetical protein
MLPLSSSFRDVGCMDTHHHMVSVRVKSVLDSCDDEEGAADDAMMELQASQQVGDQNRPCTCHVRGLLDIVIHGMYAFEVHACVAACKHVIKFVGFKEGALSSGASLMASRAGSSWTHCTAKGLRSALPLALTYLNISHLMPACFGTTVFLESDMLFTHCSQVCPGAGGYASGGGDEDMGEAGGDTPEHSQQEAADATALVAAAADMSPNANRHRTEGGSRLFVLNTMRSQGVLK